MRTSNDFALRYQKPRAFLSIRLRDKAITDRVRGRKRADIRPAEGAISPVKTEVTGDRCIMFMHMPFQAVKPDRNRFRNTAGNMANPGVTYCIGVNLFGRLIFSQPNNGAGIRHAGKYFKA